MKGWLIWLSLFAGASLFSWSFALHRITSGIRYEVMNNAMEAKICALDSAHGPARILIAGDSRGQYQLIPEVFEAMSGASALNIASIPGELISLRNALVKYPRLLSKAKLLIVSVGIYQINDGCLDPYCFSPVAFANLGMSARLGLFRSRPVELQQRYREAWHHYYRGVWGNERPCCGDFQPSEYIAVAQKGFVANPGVWDQKVFGQMYTNPWYTDLEIHGYRWKQFRETLRSFDALGIPVAIYQSPYCPAWKAHPASAANAEAEREFGRMLEAEAKGLKHVRFLDFYSPVNDSLTDSLFFDSAHLNPRGAGIFSHWMVAELQRLELLPRRRDDPD